MLNPVTMTSAQKLKIGAAPMDAGGEFYTSFADLPAGCAISIESSNPNVVGVTMLEDGLNANLSSDDIGNATITVSLTQPDGSHFPGSPETCDVTVVHAAPGAANITVGAPEDE